MRPYIAALVLASLAAGVAHAQLAPEAGKSPLICKEMQRVGSRLSPRRYCLTQAQWDYVAANARQQVGRFVQNSIAQSMPQGGGGPR